MHKRMLLLVSVSKFGRLRAPTIFPTLCSEWAGNNVIDRCKGPNQWDKTREKSALMKAAYDGYEACVVLLISAGAKVDWANAYGSNALLCASANGHTSIVKILLSEPRVSINAQDASGYSALYLAAHKGHSDIVRLLLADEQCDVNIRSGEQTKASAPLHEAAFYGHADIVQMLVDDPRVDIAVKNTLGQSAITEARKNRKDACVKILKAAYLARGNEDEEVCMCVLS